MKQKTEANEANERFGWEIFDSKTCLEVRYSHEQKGMRFEHDGAHFTVSKSEWTEFKGMVDEGFDANEG